MIPYRDLVVWKYGMDLAEEIYRITESFPRREMYSLVDQLRRASVSVVSNIAEGKGRASRGDFVRFLGFSRGSLLEIETQLTVALRLHYISPATHDQLLEKCTSCGKLLNALMRALRPAPTSRDVWFRTRGF